MDSNQIIELPEIRCRFIKMNAQQQVEGMSTDQLCSWLKTKLDDIDWQIAQQHIIQRGVRGHQFLFITVDTWIKSGLPIGVAALLVHIAESLRRQGKFLLVINF
jgi:hypothetical protein